MQTTTKPGIKLAVSLCFMMFAFFATGCYGQGFGVSVGSPGYVYGHTAPGYIIPFSGPVFRTHRPVRHKFIKPYFGSHRFGHKARFSGHSRPGRHGRR